MTKKTCTVSDWTIFAVPESGSPYRVTGIVNYDEASRFKPGCVVCSSFISRVNETSVETANTMYQLLGQGRRATVSSGISAAIESGLSYAEALEFSRI